MFLGGVLLLFEFIFVARVAAAIAKWKGLE
jgi:hypothetical protein